MNSEDMELVERLLRDTCPDGLVIEKVETIKSQRLDHGTPRYLTTVYFKNEKGISGTYEVSSLKLLRKIKQTQRYS